MHEELEFCKRQFAQSGYPHSLIDLKINQTVTAMLGYSKKEVQEQEQLSNTWIVLHLPWSGEAAAKEIEKVRNLLPRSVIRISVAYQTTKFRSLLPSFHPKTETSLNRTMLQSDLVYKYTCSKCQKVYIGETKRRLCLRAKEHGRKSSPMSGHLSKCGADFDPDGFKIVTRGLKGSTARKKYETLYIKFFSRINKTMNICEVSRDLTMF